MTSQRLMLHSDPPIRRRGFAVPLTVLLMLAAAASSCGDLQRQGQSSSYLIVNTIEAAPGADPTSFTNVLASDVTTVVDGVPTVFTDFGRVTLALGLKDPGSAGTATTPTSTNYITVDQYRLRYIRTDGRNTPGVDVPYGFDGAMTLTVGSGPASGTFIVVRKIAKDEAPLRALNFNGLSLSTIAEVTFYGHDQAGREVSAVARFSIEFSNFVDTSS